MGTHQVELFCSVFFLVTLCSCQPVQYPVLPVPVQHYHPHLGYGYQRPSLIGYQKPYVPYDTLVPSGPVAPVLLYRRTAVPLYGRSPHRRLPFNEYPPQSTLIADVRPVTATGQSASSVQVQPFIGNHSAQFQTKIPTFQTANGANVRPVTATGQSASSVQVQKPVIGNQNAQFPTQTAKPFGYPRLEIGTFLGSHVSANPETQSSTDQPTVFPNRSLFSTDGELHDPKSQSKFEDEIVTTMSAGDTLGDFINTEPPEEVAIESNEDEHVDLFPMSFDQLNDAKLDDDDDNSNKKNNSNNAKDKIACCFLACEKRYN